RTIVGRTRGEGDVRGASAGCGAGHNVRGTDNGWRFVVLNRDGEAAGSRVAAGVGGGASDVVRAFAEARTAGGRAEIVHVGAIIRNERAKGDIAGASAGRSADHDVRRATDRGQLMILDGDAEHAIGHVPAAVRSRAGDESYTFAKRTAAGRNARIACA